jgi:O-antigen/teichoic acid export membrane protein
MTRHGILYFAARVGVGLFAMATLATLTRLLGPADYGVYALATTVATITAAILFQWLNVAAGRFYASYRDRPAVLLGATRIGFARAAVLAAVAGALLALIGWPASAAMNVAVLIATLSIGRFNFLLQLANSRGAPMAFAVLSWVRALAGLAAAAVLVTLGGGPIGAVLGFAAGYLLAILAQPRPFGAVQPEGSNDARALSSKLLRYGLPLALTFVGTLAVDFADRFLIAGLLDMEAVGPYSAAYDLTNQVIGAITNVLFLSAFPAVVLAYEKSPESAERLLLKLGRSFLLVALPAAVGFASLAADIAAVLLGPAFRADAIRVIPVLAGAVWIAGFKSFYLDLVFQLRQATRNQAYLAAGMMAMNVVLNVIFLRRFGTVAAAWATLAAFAAGALASHVIGRRYLRLPPLGRDAAKGALASTIMGLALWVVPSPGGIGSVAAKVALGLTVYSFAAWLLDLAEVRTWWARRRTGPAQ